MIARQVARVPFVQVLPGIGFHLGLFQSSWGAPYPRNRMTL